MSRPALLVLLVLLAGACAAGRETSGDFRNVSDVTVTLRVEPARAKLGNTVRLTITLMNNSGRANTLRFTSSQRYDFWAVREGREVWRWSDDRSFTQQLDSLVLEGQTGTQFAETWQPDAAGDYEILAEVTAQGFEGELSARLVVEEA